MTGLNLTTALEIQATPATVLNQFMVRDDCVVFEYLKIVGPGSLPERWEGRTWSTQWVSEWVSV